MATAATLAITAAPSSFSGLQFRCRVSNAVSPAATSAAAATRATSAAAPAAATGSDAGAVAPKRVLKLVGVTSCPTGIAHTYMAADALKLTLQNGRPRQAPQQNMELRIQTHVSGKRFFFQDRLAEHLVDLI